VRDVEQRVVGVERRAEVVVSGELMTVMMTKHHAAGPTRRYLTLIDSTQSRYQLRPRPHARKSRGGHAKRRPRSFVGDIVIGNNPAPVFTGSVERDTEGQSAELVLGAREWPRTAGTSKQGCENDSSTSDSGSEVMEYLVGLRCESMLPVNPSIQADTGDPS